MGSAVANFRLDSDRRGAPSFPSSLFARRDFDFLFVFFCMGFVCFCQCFLFVCLFAVSLFRFGVGFVFFFAAPAFVRYWQRLCLLRGTARRSSSDLIESTRMNSDCASTCDCHRRADCVHHCGGERSSPLWPETDRWCADLDW